MYKNQWLVLVFICTIGAVDNNNDKQIQFKEHPLVSSFQKTDKKFNSRITKNQLSEQDISDLSRYFTKMENTVAQMKRESNFFRVLIPRYKNELMLLKALHINKINN